MARRWEELFYLSPENKMMAVDVKAGSAFQASLPQPLFETRVADPLVRYSVTRDGQPSG
jgi:hypothetical protein